MSDDFQLLFKIEGMNPGELLWIGHGQMSALSATADAFTSARVIPADAWSIACQNCHPNDTACWLKQTNQVIVKDERKVALLMDALARSANQPLR